MQIKQINHIMSAHRPKLHAMVPALETPRPGTYRTPDPRNPCSFIVQMKDAYIWIIRFELRTLDSKNNVRPGEAHPPG